MTRDPFLRLALIALCSLYVLGISAVQFWLGFFDALCVLFFGVGLAALLTLVIERDAPSLDLRRRQRQPAEGTKGFDRIA